MYIIKCIDLNTKDVTYEDYDVEDREDVPYSCYFASASRKSPQEVKNQLYDSFDEACVYAQSLTEQEIEYANCNGVPVECVYQVVEVA